MNKVEVQNKILKKLILQAPIWNKSDYESYKEVRLIFNK